MKAHLPGIIGIGIGLLAVMFGLSQVGSGQRTDFGGIALIGGIFIFGCGLVAAAIGARK